jgi:hypothetical protein
VRNANDPRRQNRYWLGADMVVEIISPDNPERDTREKRADYAEGVFLNIGSSIRKTRLSRSYGWKATSTPSMASSAVVTYQPRRSLQASPLR